MTDDAFTSWRWRNDKEIWRFTGFQPPDIVTVKMEVEWISEVLHRKNERRFAICVGDSGRYVGNVQLTQITDTDAEFHIFIGEKDYHNCGVASKALCLIMEYAANELGLYEVYLYVSENNVAALRLYEKCGFEYISSQNGRMKYKRTLNG